MRLYNYIEIIEFPFVQGLESLKINTNETKTLDFDDLEK